MIRHRFGSERGRMAVAREVRAGFTPLFIMPTILGGRYQRPPSTWHGQLDGVGEASLLHDFVGHRGVGDMRVGVLNLVDTRAAVASYEAEAPLAQNGVSEVGRH